MALAMSLSCLFVHKDLTDFQNLPSLIMNHLSIIIDLTFEH